MKFNRKKIATSVAALIAATSMTAYTFAAADYDRIKKDINVMVGIIKSSLSDSEDCHQCKADISGYYLADQGVVFSVNPGNPHIFGFRTSSAVAPSVAGISGLVEEIFEDVQISIQSDEDFNWEFHTSDDLTNDHLEIQKALREARRDAREASRELRELDLQAIHAQKDEIQSLEEQELALREQLRAAEEDIKMLSESLRRQTKERNQERESRRATKLAEQRKQFAVMEDIVLNTFCDYSRTMRHVPKSEKVSIIVNRNDAESNIYVFDQDKLANCDSQKSEVRKSALAYAF